MGEVLQLPLASSFLIRDPNTLYKLGMDEPKAGNGGVVGVGYGREVGEQERE